MLRPKLALALLLLALPGLAGCASKEEAATTDPVEAAALPPTNVTEIAPIALAVATSGVYPVNPGYDPATLEAVTGANVTVTLTSHEPLPMVMHDWVLEGADGAATERIAGGATTSVSFIAPAPGDYVFFCSVGDHRARGMEGTLTVTAA